MINNSNSVKLPQISVTSFNKCANKVTAITKKTPVEVVAPNSKRLYAAFVNNSDYPATLILGNTESANIDKGILLNPGGSFEITLINLYRGRVSAVSEEDGKISWVECVE